MADTYYEDLAVGDSRAFGSYTVDEEEILEFARQYDPQPFHVDPDAAEASMFGGLIASGWHTAAICMRLLVDNFLSETAAVGAVGVDELRWKRPVRPGDSLSVSVEVREKEPWDDGLGLVRSGTEVLAGDDVVMSMVGLVLFERREDGPGADE